MEATCSQQARPCLHGLLSLSNTVITSRRRTPPKVNEGHPGRHGDITVA